MYEYTRIERIDPEVKLSKERVRNFNEIYEPYSSGSATQQSSRCIQCGIPYCSSTGCPLGNNIPHWLKYVAEKDLQLAFDISNETSPFPEILGRICPHDRLCEGACTLNDGHGAVTIGAIEMFISDTGLSKGMKPEYPPINDRHKVAIIGSGPAGLSCATFLLRAGIKPVVYERADEPGGLLTYGIPGFKLQKDVVFKRIDLLKEAGMELKLNTEIGRDVTLDSLCEEYDAVFLAMGATEGKILDNRTYNEEQVYMAVPFLTNAQKRLLSKPYDKKYQVKGKHVMVIGGGDTAMDCVRTSIRDGAASVKCVYRRDEFNMPGSKKEVKAAKEEMVEFIFNTSPKSFVTDASGKIIGMNFLHTEMENSAVDNRASFNEVPGSEHFIEADIIILALGFNIEHLEFLESNGIKTDRYGAIIIDESMRTTREKVYSGGDATRGADLVVTATLDGREAAMAIAKSLVAGSGLH